MRINKMKRVFCLLLGIAFIGVGDIKAQAVNAPGGVTEGLRLWLRAEPDNVTLLNGSTNNVDVWIDRSGLGNNYTYQSVRNVYSSATRPTYTAVEERMNFNPAINFAAYDYLGITGGPMSKNTPDYFTSFVVYNSTEITGNRERRLYTHGFGEKPDPNTTTRQPAMGFGPARGGTGRIYARGDGGALQGSIEGFQLYSTALHMIHIKAGKGRGDEGYYVNDFGGWGWNVRETTGLTTSQTRDFGSNFLMATAGVLGGASYYASNDNNSGSFVGPMSEVLFYEKELTKEEQDRIKSYLGMKYAITLDADQSNPTLNYDYYLSNGTTCVWKGNEAPNVNYHRDVAGLVCDSTALLFINKAKSTSENSTVTMMVYKHTDEGQGVGSELVNDYSGLFWGNDGATGDVIIDPNDPDACGLVERMASRVWLVDKTNITNQDVTIRLSSSDAFPYASAAYEVYLLVADDPATLKAGRWDRAIPAVYVNGQHEVNYKFTNKYTYFSLGAKANPGACETCDFRGNKTVSFTSGTWTRGDLNRTFNLGDGFSVDVKVSIDNAAGKRSAFYSRYPRPDTGSSLNQRRRRDLDQYMTTEITPSTASAATFQIYEIDRISSRYDEVEVYGMCDNSPIYPKLNYVTSSQNSSYYIVGNKAIAKRTPTSSYNQDRGKMRIEFEYPVEKIIVRHKATGRVSSGSKRIGIGPISFSCPQPLPPVNEDGLIFTKRASYEVLLCEAVDYTFKVYNTNCEGKYVNLKDILPDKMKWVTGSVSIDTINVTDLTNINDYGRTDNLQIDNLWVPGAYSATVVAKSIFDMDALPGLYENDAVIDYQITVNNVLTDRSFTSCDVYDGCGEKSKTYAFDSDRPQQLVTDYELSKDCYLENDEILVTLKINNPNAPISDGIVEIDYNEGFTYAGGVTSSIPGIGNPIFDMDDDGVTRIEGFFSFEDFVLPTGVSTITFKLKAPIYNNLERLFDSAGNMIDWNGQIVTNQNEQAILPLDIDFVFSTVTDDVCIQTALLEARGTISVPYCSAPKGIISNKHVTGRMKK